uniref:Conotoxin superfamily F n=1 Tax=Conus ermineus TaxID=55423 RepID=A0A346CIX8_CONER|nr:conotoxin precursor superfamily F [Conus ermineus]
MQRGAVLLGVVAFLALWPQTAAKLYDADVSAMAYYGKRLMEACDMAIDGKDSSWSAYSVEDLKEDKRLYHRMLLDLVPCLNKFLDERYETP